MANVSELLDRFVELFNSRQFEEAENDLVDGAVIEEIGTGRRLTPQESTANARAWSEAYPDANGTITSKIIDGHRGAAEITWRGTNRGSFMGQAPTGKSVTVRAVVVIDTDGSQITRLAHHIDVAGMMAQLGALPGAAHT